MKKPQKGRPPAVTLIDPKYPHNVGAALRACSCWGVGQLWWTGRRVTLNVPRGPVRLLCHRFVVIPTHLCLNLAAAGNVVLYDRRLKRHLAGLEPLGPMREMLHEHRGPVYTSSGSWIGRPLKT